MVNLVYFGLINGSSNLWSWNTQNCSLLQRIKQSRHASFSLSSSPRIFSVYLCQLKLFSNCKSFNLSEIIFHYLNRKMYGVQIGELSLHQKHTNSSLDTGRYLRCSNGFLDNGRLNNRLHPPRRNQAMSSIQKTLNVPADQNIDGSTKSVFNQKLNTKSKSIRPYEESRALQSRSL